MMYMFFIHHMPFYISVYDYFKYIQTSDKIYNEVYHYKGDNNELCAKIESIMKRYGPKSKPKEFIITITERDDNYIVEVCYDDDDQRIISYKISTNYINSDILPLYITFTSIILSQVNDVKIRCNINVIRSRYEHFKISNGIYTSSTMYQVYLSYLKATNMCSDIHFEYYDNEKCSLFGDR